MQRSLEHTVSSLLIFFFHFGGMISSLEEILEKECIEIKILRPCVSENVFILFSYVFNGLSESRIAVGILFLENFEGLSPLCCCNAEV